MVNEWMPCTLNLLTFLFLLEGAWDFFGCLGELGFCSGCGCGSPVCRLLFESSAGANEGSGRPHRHWCTGSIAIIHEDGLFIGVL